MSAGNAICTDILGLPNWLDLWRSWCWSSRVRFASRNLYRVSASYMECVEHQYLVHVSPEQGNLIPLKRDILIDSFLGGKGNNIVKYHLFRWDTGPHLARPGNALAKTAESAALTQSSNLLSQPFWLNHVINLYYSGPGYRLGLAVPNQWRCHLPVDLLGYT